MNARNLLSLLFFMLSACSMPRVIVLNDPLDARQHNDLGASYDQRQEYDLALREYQRAAALDKKWALPYFNQGNVYVKQARWTDAIEAYETALLITPNSAWILNNLAWVQIEHGERAVGLELAEKAVSKEQDNPAFWDTLASGYLKVGRFADAETAVEKALALEPAPGLRAALLEKLAIAKQ